MKQNQIILIFIGFLLVALMATNPSTAEHKEAVKEKVLAALEGNNSNGNSFQKLGEQLGQTIGMVIIDKMIKRDNYLLFSITKSKYIDNDEKDKIIGFGLLGKVYLFDNFSNDITEKIEEENNPIIGSPIIVGNMEIAENEFPNEMTLIEAKNVSSNIGKGWRLPNSNEREILWKNVKNSKDGCLWSSDDIQRDWNGKLVPCNVRLVRLK